MSKERYSYTYFFFNGRNNPICCCMLLLSHNPGFPNIGLCFDIIFIAHIMHKILSKSVQRQAYSKRSLPTNEVRMRHVKRSLHFFDCVRNKKPRAIHLRRELESPLPQQRMAYFAGYHESTISHMEETLGVPKPSRPNLVSNFSTLSPLHMQPKFRYNGTIN